MLKRILAIWFGFICAYCGLDVFQHGIRGGLNWRNPVKTKIIALIVFLFGVYLLIHGVSPDIAKKISSRIFKRKNAWRLTFSCPPPQYWSGFLSQKSMRYSNDGQLIAHPKLCNFAFQEIDFYSEKAVVPRVKINNRDTLHNLRVLS